ncbi:MAG: hypothetical protein JWO28_1985, partial [Hyphomicrobiales bacterium]|nr:hypothetical protein [Hyphomicrobiales bacterium]
MGLENFVRRAVFGRKSVDQDTPLPYADLPSLGPIAAELRRLDIYRQGLGNLAIRYVATGDQPAVIEAIDACQKATPMHMAPYHKDITALHTVSRDTALALVTGTLPPGPEVARLMQVRLAVRLFTPSYYGPQVPPEKLPLVAFFAMTSAGLNAAQVNYSVPWKTLITLRQLFEHVKHCNGTMVDLFAFILARDGTDHIVPESWHGSGECAELMRTYPTAYAEALLKAEPKRRLGAVKLAEHHGVCNAIELESALLAMLAKPFGKDDREIATSALARLESAQLLALLQREMPGAHIDTRFGLVHAAGRNGSAEILALLGERDKVEKAAKVKAAIQAVLEASAPAIDTPAQIAGGAGYAAIDGSFVSIPPAIDLGDDEAPPASDEECIAFMAIVDAIQLERADMLAKQVPGREDRSRYFQPLTREEIEASFSLMTEGVPLPPGINYVLIASMRRTGDGRAWYGKMLDRLPLRVALRSLLGNSHGEVASLVGAQTYLPQSSEFAVDRLRQWIEHGRFGLRDVATTDHLRTALSQPRNNYNRAAYSSPLRELPHDAVWPWLAENLAVFDEAMGLQPAAKPIPLDRTLATLELLPRIPQRYLAKLLEIAVTEKRPLRRQAMALLRDASDLVRRIEALLDDARQHVRINAATWLADLRSQASEPALRKRLKKEKSDPVRATLIEALQRLGADLSDIIGPDSLIAEAAKAAEKAAPQLPQWLVGAGLPAVHFRNGATVPEPVLRHWLALAIRLKDSGATGQFGIYLDQLDPADARTLSNWILESWISYDTHSASLDEANAFAVANYATDWRWMHRQQTPELRDQVIALLRQQKLGELLNSGSETKGMLALACRAEPIWAANRVRWFLK